MSNVQLYYNSLETLRFKTGSRLVIMTFGGRWCGNVRHLHPVSVLCATALLRRQPKREFRHMKNCSTRIQQTMITTVMFPATKQKLLPPPAEIPRARPLADKTVISVASVAQVTLRPELLLRVRYTQAPRSALELNLVVR